MANPPWLKALKEACYHAHDPALHYETEEGILFCMLRTWEAYPTPLNLRLPLPASFTHTYETYSVEEVFALLQRATVEGNEHDRAFALILLGALATLKALDIVRSFLVSPSLKERWASVIALGRHKDERVFPLLQTLLLDGFLVSSPSTSKEEAERHGGTQDAYPPIGDLSVAVDYEWYMHQRWECALVLGAWGNPCVVPRLREALDTAWKMEQMWPDYMGFQDGPEIWHAFQDRLAFALGQLGAWQVLLDLDLPANRLLIATIYLALGALQVQDASIFYQNDARHLFSLPSFVLEPPSFQESRLAKLPAEKQERIKHRLASYYADLKERWLAEHPFVGTSADETTPGQASGFLRDRTRPIPRALSPGSVRAGQRKPPCPSTAMEWSVRHVRPVSRLRRCTLNVWCGSAIISENTECLTRRDLPLCLPPMFSNLCRDQ